MLGDTILKGVTRDSVLTILKDMGIPAEERMINIDEIVEAYKKGQVNEVFGMGTAAVISPVKELKYKDVVMKFDPSTYAVAAKVKQALYEIRSGIAEDTHDWMLKVEN
jgi:branched-chain amino acid aminotransferase